MMYAIIFSVCVLALFVSMLESTSLAGTSTASRTAETVCVIVAVCVAIDASFRLEHTRACCGLARRAALVDAGLVATCVLIILLAKKTAVLEA